jgi:N-acetylmuramoyl-L-alanine amidase
MKRFVLYVAGFFQRLSGRSSGAISSAGGAGDIKAPTITITIPARSIFSTDARLWVTAKNGFKPTWIVVHHSATTDGDVKDWDAIRRYHKEVKGWADIGYHLGLENVAGRYEVFSGRKIGEIGAHALGFNAKSIGICVVGNYDKEPPKPDCIFLLASLIRQLQREFGIPRDQVIGHVDTYRLQYQKPLKTCPGLMFPMENLRARLIDP